MLNKSIEFDIDLMNSTNVDDMIINKLYESIGNSDELNVLEESASFIDINKSYNVLVESISVYNDLKKESKNLDDVDKQIGFFGKCKKTLKSAFDWWYKEDPNKKFKTLRIILKLALDIAVLIIGIKLPGSEKLADKALMSTVGNVARKISYKGSNKILRKMLNERAILLATIKTIYFSLLGVIRKIDKSIYSSINSKDIEANIQAYDKAVDRFNNLIEKTDDPTEKKVLIESKKNMEDSLAELIKLKNDAEKFNAKKEG